MSEIERPDIIDEIEDEETAFGEDPEDDYATGSDPDVEDEDEDVTEELVSRPRPVKHKAKKAKAKTAKTKLKLVKSDKADKPVKKASKPKVAKAASVKPKSKSAKAPRTAKKIAKKTAKKPKVTKSKPRSTAPSKKSIKVSTPVHQRTGTKSAKAKIETVHVRLAVSKDSETQCGGSHSPIWNMKGDRPLKSVGPQQAKQGTCGRCIRVCKAKGLL